MRQVLTTFVCDKCASEEDVRTVSITSVHVADLCKACDRALNDALQPFLDVARKAAAPMRQVKVAKYKPVSRKLPAAQSTIRAWAQANGYPVSDRGRLPNSVVGQYQKANA